MRAKPQPQAYYDGLAMVRIAPILRCSIHMEYIVSVNSSKIERNNKIIMIMIIYG